MGRRAPGRTVAHRDGAPSQSPRHAQAIGPGQMIPIKSSELTPPRHFAFAVEGKVATITLNRPERKNPLTFDSYAELRDLFRALARVEDVKAVVISGAEGNFCSG